MARLKWSGGYPTPICPTKNAPSVFYASEFGISRKSSWRMARESSASAANSHTQTRMNRLHQPRIFIRKHA